MGQVIDFGKRRPDGDETHPARWEPAARERGRPFPGNLPPPARSPDPGGQLFLPPRLAPCSMNTDNDRCERRIPAG